MFLLIELFLISLYMWLYWEKVYGWLTIPVGVCGHSKGSVADSKYSIGPLVGDQVELSVELTHRDRLGVDHCDFHSVFVHLTLSTAPA